jgi:hypothetical protein
VLPAEQQAKFADPVILQNMLTRTRIWGDMMQARAGKLGGDKRMARR